MRAYELARELGVESKEVLARAADLGIEIASASSGLDDDTAALIRLAFEKRRPARPLPPAAAAAAEAAPAPPPPAAGPRGSAGGGSPRSPALRPPRRHRRRPGRGDRASGGRCAEGLIARGRWPAPPSPCRRHLEAVGAALGYACASRMPGRAGAGAGRPARRPAPSGGRLGAPPAGGHGHGPRRPRQDQAARPHPAGATSWPRRRAASPSTSAPTRCASATAGSPSSTPPATRPSPACGPAGAEVTDIVVLVVAADDGVMPQTVEAISHAKAAGVPIVVAINKMDLPGADPYRVRAQLTEHGLLVEQLGGDVVSAEVSAITGQGIEQLLEYLDLIAELEEFSADPSAPASGTVIEAQLDRGGGRWAPSSCSRAPCDAATPSWPGAVAGRVRAMFDHTGAQVDAAPPEHPGAHHGLGRRAPGGRPLRSGARRAGRPHGGRRRGRAPGAPRSW